MNAATKTRHFLIVWSTALALGACTQEPKSAAYTVDEYLAQPEMMEKKLQECANNPGETKNDPDCINVKTAAARHSLGSLRDLPPMDLPSPDRSSGGAREPKPSAPTDHP